MGALPNPTQGGGAASARERRRPSDGNNATMPGPALPGGDIAGGQNSATPPFPGQAPDNGQTPFPGAQPYPNAQPLPGQTGQPTAIQPGQPTPVYPPGVPVPAPQGFPGQAGISPGMVTPGQPAYYQGMPAQPGMPGSPSVTGGASAVSPGNTSASGNSFVGGGGSFVGGGGSYVGGGSTWIPAGLSAASHPSGTIQLSRESPPFPARRERLSIHKAAECLPIRSCLGRTALLPAFPNREP